MANTRHRSPETVSFGDPDNDFDGTFPGSKPIPEISSTDTISYPMKSRRTPRCTTKQDREYFDQAIIPDLPVATEVDILAADLVLDAFRASREEVPIYRGSLTDSNGKVVPGSRGWSLDRIQDYMKNNPGAHTI